jgi:hypothetical protein
MIPYVQDQEGFIKSQALAQGVLSKKLNGSILADPRDREWVENLARYSPEAVAGALDDLFKQQRQQRDQIDAENRRNKVAMDAEARGESRQISMAKLNNDYSIAAELRAREDAKIRGQTSIEQQMDARQRNDKYRTDQLEAAARNASTEEMGNLDGPPQFNEPNYRTLRSLPPDMQGNFIAGQLGARQEAGNRRGVAENLRGAGMGSSEAELMAATSSGGRVNPSVVTALTGNKAEQAVANQRQRAAEEVYRKHGSTVVKEKGKAMTMPGAMEPPTPEEFEQARRGGNQRAFNKVSAWNDVVKAREEAARYSNGGGMFSGVKQQGDALDSFIDGTMSELGD